MKSPFPIPEFVKVQSADITPALNELIRDINATASPLAIGCANAAWFGAIGDGKTDDTAAVQAAINYCLSDPNNPIPLLISGVVHLTASLIINLPAGYARSPFRIIGLGKSAGFSVSSAITMFDTTIPFTATPVAEMVTFSNIVFQSSDPALAAFVMTAKFLVVNFLECVFRGIKAANATTYFQTWKFVGGSVWAWEGTFFKTTDAAYDILFDHVEFEGAGFGGSGISLARPTQVRLVDNSFEAGVAFFYCATGTGLTITGNYLEGNSGVDIVVSDSTVNGAYSIGVNLASNLHINNGATYPVVTGVAYGRGASNVSTGNLYDDTNLGAGTWLSIADYAAGTLNASGNKISVKAAP